MDRYISWLKQTNQPLFEIAGTYWRPYHKALVPASLKPEPIHLSAQQARKLLEQSGAPFLRYFSRTVKHPTAFWYTACREYIFNNLPQKVRCHIRRGYKDCRVERVDPVWLADNGYACYKAAFSRYRNGEPESKEEFEDMSRGAAGGPFEFWGAFVGNHLAGFTKCAVGQDYSACLVMKLDPEYIHLSTASALHDTMLRTYVEEQRKIVYAGFRSVVHETNTHDFLKKFGYSRVYCDLQVVYRPAVEACVNLLYSCRSLLDRVPANSLKTNLQGLLNQEEIRRSTEFDGSRATRPSLVARIARSVRGNRYGTTEK